MIVGLVGARHPGVSCLLTLSWAGPPCSGKATAARFLVASRGFIEVVLSEDESAGGRLEETYRTQVTNFRANFVIYPLRRAEHVRLLTERPLCLLVSLDAPTRMRHERHVIKYGGGGSLDAFVNLDDAQCYAGGHHAVRQAIFKAHVHILNNGSHEDLHSLVPLWDTVRLRAQICARRHIS